MPRLTKAERLEVTELIKNGSSLVEVAKKMNTSRSTIHRLIKRHKATGSTDDRPRSGRPRIPIIAESSWFECVGQKRSFVCTECGKTFRHYRGLKNHIKIHSDEKDYQCDQCGRGFLSSYTLVRHLRTHTGEKPFICEYCARGFADMGTMRTHIRTHTGERPHKCHLCDHATRSAGNLHAHMKVHRDKDGNIPIPINIQPTKSKAVPIFEGIDVLRKARKKYEQLNNGSWLEDSSEDESDEDMKPSQGDSYSFTKLNSSKNDDETTSKPEYTSNKRVLESEDCETASREDGMSGCHESDEFIKVKQESISDSDDEVDTNKQKEESFVLSESEIKKEPEEME